MFEEPPIHEADAIQRVREGHPDAYAHLVRASEARVRRMCAALLGDAAAGDDAAQDVFLKAYRALGSFRGDAAFSTWLYRIAANHCRDLLRARARHPTESWDALLEEHGEQIHQLLASPEDSHAARASAETVEAMLAHLPPDVRVLLTLREIEGLSYAELAVALGCSVDAVKARLRRARQTLTEKLRHVLNPPIV